MADKKISELDAITGAATAADDVFVVVDTSGSVTRKITRDELKSALSLSASASFDQISMGDNDKILFGDSNDLEIYHDGSNSYISDVGAGNLNIQGNNLILEDPNGVNFLGGNGSTGAVTVYYSGAAKLATTATGIDVTGTATMDGLTVDGNSVFTTADNSAQITLISTDTDALVGPKLNLWRNSGFGTNGDLIGEITFTGEDTVGGTNVFASISSIAEQTNNGSEDGSLHFNTLLNGTLAKRLSIGSVSSGGDISFYEDTGSDVKFFWDASAEALGIGTTSPATALHITGTAPEITVEDSTGDAFRFGNNNGTFRVFNITDNREDFKINGNGDITVSGGIYIGGTGTDNYLSDYEEGSYTVQLFDASSGGNASSTTTTGNYTKIGNQVTVRFDSLNNIDTTGMTGANDFYFSLPFSSGSTGRSVGSVLFDTLTFVSGRTMVTPLVLDNASRGRFHTSGSAVTDLASEVQDINSGATDIMTFTLTYFTD